MRNSLDEIIKRGADGGDWYDRYRASIDEVTGGDLKDNEWMSSLEGQYSAGVAPQSELAFALKIQIPQLLKERRLKRHVQPSSKRQ